MVWPFEVDGRGGRWDSSAGVPLRGATSGYPSFNLFEIGLSAKWRKGTESAASPHTREGKITLWAMGKKTKLCVSVPLCLSNQSVLHIYYLKSQLSQISNHNYHNYLKSQLSQLLILNFHCAYKQLAISKKQRFLAGLRPKIPLKGTRCLAVSNINTIFVSSRPRHRKGEQ